jgi:ubiquinone/menaquinone biosynthesis C-methylase UbiE
MMDADHVPDIAAAYDSWAEVYDTHANPTRDLAAVVFRQTRLDLASRDVLEIGCGTGANTQWLLEQSQSVLALDFSREMLRHAQARVRSSRVRFVAHDVRSAWPLADASIDVVVAMLVLEHVEHLPSIFAESARVLRAGGEMFLCEFHPMQQLRGRQAAFTHPRTGEPVHVAAFVHDTSEYVNVALRAGFQVVQMGEWRDPEASRCAVPRLLSLHFRLDVTPSA